MTVKKLTIRLVAEYYLKYLEVSWDVTQTMMPVMQSNLTQGETAKNYKLV